MTQKLRPYQRLRDFVSTIGGSMTNAPLPPGRIWTISLWGETRTFRCRNDQVNPLDGLYKSDPADPPHTWADFPEGERTPLVDDVFYKLADLMRQRDAPRVIDGGTVVLRRPTPAPPTGLAEQLREDPVFEGVHDYPRFISVSWVNDPPPGCELKVDTQGPVCLTLGQSAKSFYLVKDVKTQVTSLIDVQDFDQARYEMAEGTILIEGDQVKITGDRSGSGV
jgi:hypothetical protein